MGLSITPSGGGAVFSEQTNGDANVTWTAGKTTVRQTAALTTNRTGTLPLAAGYAAGTVIVYTDRLTSGAFGTAWSPSGSDTLNGAGSSVTVFTAGGTARFESDGVSAWTQLDTHVFAATGANADITSLSGLTGAVVSTNTGTAAAPTLTFRASNYGWFSRSANTAALSLNGTECYDFEPTFVMIPSGSGFAFNSQNNTTAGGRDTVVGRGGVSVVSFETASNVTGATWRAIPLTPAQIVADTNNYSPATPSFYQRWSTDASRSITGLTFSSGAQVTGQSHVICNVGAQNIVIVNESASSTAANRFHNSTGADITLASDGEVNCWYDAIISRWRVTKRGF